MPSQPNILDRELTIIRPSLCPKVWQSLEKCDLEQSPSAIGAAFYAVTHLIFGTLFDFAYRVIPATAFRMMQSCGCKKRMFEPTKMNAVDEQVSDGCIRKNRTDDYSSLVGPIKPKVTSKHIL